MSDAKDRSLLESLSEPSFKVLGYVVLALLFMYILTPLAWMFITAFHPKGSPFIEIPESPTIENFIMLFTGRPIGTKKLAAHPIYITNWIVNSLVIATATMLIVISLSALAGYSLSRLDFPGKSVFMCALLLIGFMPMIAKMLPLYKLLISLGLIDNLFGAAVVVASGLLPAQTWIIKGFFDGIPRELEEQAWVCGCTRLGSLSKVVFPLAGPGIAVVALMSFLSGWGNFTVPLILIRSEYLYPISLGIASVFTHHPGEVGLVVDYGPICALGVVYMIPSLVIYYFTRKHLMEVRLGKMEVR
ncbi:TPA: carbohydrate ABC transporter permease [Candidatus Bathyarchaeota archaeon]|nr:carbohydrate ABC transporter permease [Candidatus Bathyarchaeota archaeon]